MYEVTAYIPDMSGEDSKRALHRQRQARYRGPPARWHCALLHTPGRGRNRRSGRPGMAVR
jgi:hypothetical protein